MSLGCPLSGPLYARARLLRETGTCDPACRALSGPLTPGTLGSLHGRKLGLRGEVCLSLCGQGAVVFRRLSAAPWASGCSSYGFVLALTCRPAFSQCRWVFAAAEDEAILPLFWLSLDPSGPSRPFRAPGLSSSTSAPNTRIGSFEMWADWRRRLHPLPFAKLTPKQASGAQVRPLGVAGFDSFRRPCLSLWFVSQPYLTPVCSPLAPNTRIGGSGSRAMCLPQVVLCNLAGRRRRLTAQLFEQGFHVRRVQDFRSALALYVFLGYLHPSLGFGRVVGKPPPHAHPLSHRLGLLSLLSLEVSGVDCSSLHLLHYVQPLRVPFRFSPLGLVPRDLLPGPLGDAPNSTGATASPYPGYSTPWNGPKSSLTASCRPRCVVPSQVRVARPFFLLSLPVCECLRGVSVALGLSPQTRQRLPVTSDLAAFWLRVLTSLAMWIVPFARSFLVLVFLALLRVLAIPWRASTPAGRAYCFCLSGAPTRILRPLGYAGCDGHVLEWRPWRDRKGRVGRYRSGLVASRATRGLWLSMLRLLTVPGSGGLGAFTGVQAMWIFTHGVSPACGMEFPDPTPEPPSASAHPAAAAPAMPVPHAPEMLRMPDRIRAGNVARANDYIAVDHNPRGPPPPSPVRVTVDNAVSHTRPVVFQECTFSAWVGAPHYVPELLQFPMQLPCDIEDVLDATERKVQCLKLEGCNRAIAVRPQPFAACAAVLLAPDWSTYSGLAVVCLDLRDLGDPTDGRVIASYVTRPTCLAELCREAHVQDHRHCRVYIGSDTSPLQPDEEVHLASGCLVTFMRTDRLPCFSNDLQYRLQFPAIWNLPVRFPLGPAVRSSLLLLHSSGRYLYRPQATHDPRDVAAARFVGVDRASVDFHTPRQGSLERVMYRGIRVRGVIAIADRLFAEQFVVFLDLRQVAEGVQFVVLEVPHILLTDLPRLVKTKPPPGWVLHVTGGRRRRDRIDVHNSDTLVVGYRYVCDSDASEPAFSPTTADEEDEGGETEESDSDPSAPNSRATTRSRSRSRRSPAHRSPTSSDRSYFGGVEYLARDLLPFPSGSIGTMPLPLAETSFPSWEFWAGIASFQSDRASRWVVQPEDALLGLALRVAERLKLLSEPVPATLAQDRQLEALRNATEHLGGLWRYHAPATRLFAGLPVVEAISSDEDEDTRIRRASFIICTPEYVPEQVTIEVQFPAVLRDVMPLLRQARRRDRDCRFPCLLPVTPQPLVGTGVLLATPHWRTNALYVCIDATRMDGRLFAVCMPTYASRADLLEAANVTRRRVEVYVGLDQHPLPPDVLAHLVPGVTVIVVPADTLPPPISDLGQMLLDACLWSSHSMLPAPPAPGAYCLVSGPIN